MSLFDEVAKTWDEKPSRVENARKVGRAIVESLPVDRKWQVLEIGAGTGLLTFYLKPFVGRIVAVDSSRGMIEVLREKVDRLGVEGVEPLLLDAEKELPQGKFDLVVLHMTLHHVKDISSLFKSLYPLVKEGGFLAVGDLLKEDGTFHRSNVGVYHFGFSQKELCSYFKAAGFKPFFFKIVHSIERNGREYPIFLGVAVK